MAGSITYIHVALPLNLTALELQAKIIAVILTNTTDNFRRNTMQPIIQNMLHYLEFCLTFL